MAGDAGGLELPALAGYSRPAMADSRASRDVEIVEGVSEAAALGGRVQTQGRNPNSDAEEDVEDEESLVEDRMSDERLVCNGSAAGGGLDGCNHGQSVGSVSIDDVVTVGLDNSVADDMKASIFQVVKSDEELVQKHIVPLSKSIDPCPPLVTLEELSPFKRQRIDDSNHFSSSSSKITQLMERHPGADFNSSSHDGLKGLHTLPVDVAIKSDGGGPRGERAHALSALRSCVATTVDLGLGATPLVLGEEAMCTAGFEQEGDDAGGDVDDHGVEQRVDVILLGTEVHEDDVEDELDSADDETEAIAVTTAATAAAETLGAAYAPPPGVGAAAASSPGESEGLACSAVSVEPSRGLGSGGGQRTAAAAEIHAVKAAMEQREMNQTAVCAKLGIRQARLGLAPPTHLALMIRQMWTRGI
eukprot:6173107-Pleurochrysis_carterae.AAC.3